MRIHTVGVLTVLGRRGALGGVRSQMISVGVVLMHGRERISGQRGSGTGEARVRMLLIPAAGPGALMRQRADLMRELVRARYVVTARVTAPQTRGIVQVVVLELDEGGLAAL